jgi:hypothetical protein
VFAAYGPASPFFTGAGILLASTAIAMSYHRRFSSTFARAAVPAQG